LLKGQKVRRRHAINFSRQKMNAIQAEKSHSEFRPLQSAARHGTMFHIWIGKK
jgi:hypothetical protein